MENVQEDEKNVKEQWYNDINLLLEYGRVGFYKYCEVTQIVIICNDTKKAWNYFTNINFSSIHKESKEAVYLTPKLLDIKKGYKLAISRYTISIKEFMRLYMNAVENQKWEYTDKNVDSEVYLDLIYPTNKKFIPETDPIGGQYNLDIPIEQCLYASNFMGNYYLCELYSCNKLESFLDEKDYHKIQHFMEECKLNYNIKRLWDRIGNVVCKFNVESIECKPLKLSPQRGVSGRLVLSDRIEKQQQYIVHLNVEHDGMVYDNTYAEVELGPDCREYVFEISPNQCHNTVICSEKDSNLILYMAKRDYSVYSTYLSQINLPTIISRGVHNNRELIINGKAISVELSGISRARAIDIFREMNEAGKRQRRNLDEFYVQHRYLTTYSCGERNKAILDFKHILNDAWLLWDLQEIWIIDPYLKADDILNTVVFCEKENVKIKCLTNIGEINGNQETCYLKSESMEQGQSLYERAKQEMCEKLSKAIVLPTDMSLDFRSVRSGHGTPFHDRYLIMKYEINRARVWSLGISVNSLGKKHHTVQIVEAPETIADVFYEMWNKTDCEECKIFQV